MTPREEAERKFNHKRLAAMDAVRRDKRLTSAIKTVGAELFSKVYFNTGFADVDQQHLVEKLGLSVRTVKTAIKALQEAGYFEVVRPGRRSSNRYRPIFEPREVQNLHLSESPEVQKLHLSGVPEVQKTSAGGAKNDRREVQNLPHSTSLENSLEASLGRPEGAADGDQGADGRPSLFEEIAGTALRAKLGEAVYASWLGKLKFVSQGEGTLTLSAPTKFIASWVRSHYEPAILECFGRADIERVELTVRTSTVPSLGDRRTATDTTPPPNPDAEWLLTVGIDLVADLTGVGRNKADEQLKDWLIACSRNPAALREIVMAAAEQNLQGEPFRRVVRERAQKFRQGELKFGVEQRLRKRSAS